MGRGGSLSRTVSRNGGNGYVGVLLVLAFACVELLFVRVVRNCLQTVNKMFLTGGAHVERDRVPEGSISRDVLLRWYYPLDRGPHPEGDRVRHRKASSDQVGAIVVAGAVHARPPLLHGNTVCFEEKLSKNNLAPTFALKTCRTTFEDKLARKNYAIAPNL